MSSIIQNSGILAFFVALFATCCSLCDCMAVHHTATPKLPNQAQKKWISWKSMDQTKYLGLLTAASVASSVVSHPLHVIMMRQQAGKLARSTGAFGVISSMKDCIQTIGVKGLFRGWIPLALEAPSHALYFAVTESSREYINTAMLGRSSPIAPFYLDLFQSIVSSVLANTISLIPWVCTCIFFCPLWSAVFI